MRIVTYEDELKRDGRLEATAEQVVKMINKLHYSLKDAMDFCEVEDTDKEEIERMVKELLAAVPA